MVWTEFRSGAQLTVINTEHTLAGTGDAQDLPVGSLYIGVVDLNSMLAGDTVEVRIYIKARTVDAYRLYDIATFVDVQSAPGTQTIPVVGSSAVRFTLKQTTGSPRTFPWSVGRAP
jgi:hypothetical protein